MYGEYTGVIGLPPTAPTLYPVLGPTPPDTPPPSFTPITASYAPVYAAPTGPASPGLTVFKETKDGTVSVLEDSLRENLVRIQEAAQYLTKGSFWNTVADSFSKITPVSSYRRYEDHSIHLGGHTTVVNNHYGSKDSAETEQKKKENSQTQALIGGAIITLIGSLVLGLEWGKWNTTKGAIEALEQLDDVKDRSGDHLVRQDVVDVVKKASSSERKGKVYPGVFENVRDAAFWGLCRRATLLASGIIIFVGAYISSPEMVHGGSLLTFGTICVMLFTWAKNRADNARYHKALESIDRNITEILDRQIS